MANHEGNKVPQVTFRTRIGNDWKSVTTDDVFKGKPAAARRASMVSRARSSGLVGMAKCIQERWCRLLGDYSHLAGPS